MKMNLQITEAGVRFPMHQVNAQIFLRVVKGVFWALCLVALNLNSVVLASEASTNSGSTRLVTIPYGTDGGRVVRDRIVVYWFPAANAQNNYKTTSSAGASGLQPQIEISNCGSASRTQSQKTASTCQPEYILQLNTDGNNAVPSSNTVASYIIIPVGSNASAEITEEEYQRIISIASSDAALRNYCTTPAHLVVAGNSWASGGNSWASGGNSWASGGNSWASGGDSTITYEDAYDQQWALEMVEKSANLYGQGEGVSAAFIDVFDHGSAAAAGIHIIEDELIEFAEVISPTLDLSLHGNVVHSVFNSIAPNTQAGYTKRAGVNAIGIPVFNQNGMAINAGVVRGVEVALERLPNNSILNMSFGTESASLDHCTRLALDALFEEAQSRGITPVASAGNAGSDATEYPAASEKVHGVAAVGPDRAETDYSNRGGILAPGGTDDDPLLVRVPRPALEIRYPLNGVRSRGNEYVPAYATATGTSFAAPYVSATIANLLADGVVPSEISTKLGHITDSNCGIVALNPFYATECLELQEVTRSDFGVQRLPHPVSNGDVTTWNTEPYWIGPPPCGGSGKEQPECHSSPPTVSQPYLYNTGSRTVGSRTFGNAQLAYSNYLSDISPSKDLNDYGIQLVYLPGLDGTAAQRPVWLGVPDVCDEVGENGANFDEQACDGIDLIAPTSGVVQNNFYYHGKRPVLPSMIILDDHNCQNFDGKALQDAAQAACLYRATSVAIALHNPSDSEPGWTETKPVDEDSPFLETRPPYSLSSSPASNLKAAENNQDGTAAQETSSTAFLPVIAQP